VEKNTKKAGLKGRDTSYKELDITRAFTWGTNLAVKKGGCKAKRRTGVWREPKGKFLSDQQGL